MNRRVTTNVLIAVMTMLIAIGRYEDGKSGVLFWIPLVTSLFAFAAVLLMWRKPADKAGASRPMGGTGL